MCIVGDTIQRTFSVNLPDGSGEFHVLLRGEAWYRNSRFLSNFSQSSDYVSNGGEINVTLSAKLIVNT